MGQAPRKRSTHEVCFAFPARSVSANAVRLREKLGERNVSADALAH